MLSFFSGINQSSLFVIMLLILSVGCQKYSKGKSADLEIQGGDAGIVDAKDDTVDLNFSSSLIPGTGAKDVVDVVFRNVGNADLEILSIELLDFNLESEGSSAKNQYVRIEWLGFEPLIGFPRSIKSANAESWKIQIVYQPEGIDNNAATLKIVSDDPDRPVSYVTLKPYACIPGAWLNPPSDTFYNATPTNPETKTFKIENQGTCEFTVDKIEAMSTSSVFTLHQDFINGQKVDTTDAPGYAPAKFRVTYQPNSNSAADTMTYAIYTSDPNNNPIYLSVGTKVEGCGYELSYSTQSQGFLDFTLVENGTKTLTVNVLNNGPSTFSIVTGGINFSQDPDGTHYSWDLCLPQADGSEMCDLKPPVALAEGKSLDIKVTYKPATVDGLNTNLEVDYSCGGKHSFLIPAYGGDPKPCFDLAPGSGDSPNPIQFSGPKGEERLRNLVIYNCGNKDLTLTKVEIHDDFYPNDPSEYWTVINAPTGDVVIPVGGLHVLELLMKVTDNNSKVGGTLFMKHLDKNGVEIDAVGIDLQGIIDPLGTKPIADCGSAADYVGAKVGVPLLLSAANSQPGSEGLYEKGYLWYLLQKPAGSNVILNGAPSTPGRTVIPDTAGKYKFGLQVHGMSGDFLYSDEVTVEVDVAP
ncbi:MAG TPA: hypothetical protein EYN06_04385 [Myxococcales bacterium]|nr:hypothetical protein [Myxococcales bacterium]HIN85698.1 hypothetical protein [Myxococcales bacterium]